jgi:hypothetical protein
MKQNAVAVIAAVAAFVAGLGVAAYYGNSRNRLHADEALASLSDHFNVIGLIQTGDTRNAARFLTLLADGDVMRLMTIEGDHATSTDYRRRVLSSYGEFRRKNPQFYGVPGYIDQGARAEYEQNLKKIQAFLDSAAQPPPKSIK